MAYSNIALGMSYPGDSSNEGKTLAIKDGKYSAAYGLIMLDFKYESGTITSDLTAGEIKAYVEGGAYITARAEITEGMWQQLQIGNIDYSGGSPSMVLIASTSNGNAPVCVTASASGLTEKFTASMS